MIALLVFSALTCTMLILSLRGIKRHEFAVKLRSMPMKNLTTLYQSHKGPNAKVLITAEIKRRNALWL